MKGGTLQLISEIKGHEPIGQPRRKDNLPRLTHEETENLNTPIISDLSW